MTRDAAGQSFYFNNEKSTADFSALGAAPSRLRLGLGETGGDRPLVDGAFANIQLWNRALGDAEVFAAYEGTPPNIADTDLIGYWPLSEAGAGALDNAKTGGPALTPLGGAAVEILSAGANPVIRGGGAEPGAHITVTAEDGAAAAPVTVTVVANAAGVWSVTLPLTPESVVDYNITVIQTDIAGNNSIASQGVMRISPEVIGAPVLDAASDTGLRGDNVTLNATPTVRGVLPPDYVLGDDFIVYINGEEAARANSEAPIDGLTLNQAEGVWTYTRPATSPLEPGDYRIQAGFGAEIAPALVLTVNRPDAPDLEAASDSGALNTDNITNDATPTLSGDLPAGTSAGSQIALLLNGAPVTEGLSINLEDNSWRYTPNEPLTDGVYTFILEIDNAQSAPLAVTIDTEAATPAHALDGPPGACLGGAARPRSVCGDKSG